MGKAKAPPPADHTFNSVKQEILGYVEYWKPRLGLEHWDIRMTFVPSAYEKNPTTLARVSPFWMYRAASIEFYLPTIQEVETLRRETTVIHELIHCVLNPCIHSKLNIDLEECVTVDLAKAFLRMKYPKRSF